MNQVKDVSAMTESDARSTRVTICSDVTPRGVQVSVDRISAGWTPAGSRMRWQPACYAYGYRYNDGSTGGRQYATEAEAMAAFQRAMMA